MQNLLPAEITQANSYINLMSDRERITTNFDSRIYYSYLVDLGDDVYRSPELCHDCVLEQSVFVSGNYNSRLNKECALFFVPRYYKNAPQILEKFNLFMNELQTINNLTDEEVGSCSFINTGANGLQYFCYKFGTIFKQNRGFAYIPFKIFRLAITCEDNCNDIKSAMKSNQFNANDYQHYAAFADSIYTCLSNLRHVKFSRNYFIGDARTAEKQLKENFLLQKQKEEEQKRLKEAEEKRLIKLEQLKANVIRKKEYPVMVFSRHPSHAPLRQLQSTCRMLIRLGSTTVTPPKMVGKCVEINSIEAVQTSSSKIRMKQAFHNAGVQTSSWIVPQTEQSVRQWAAQFAEKKNVKYVSKSEFGSRGEGNRLHNSLDELIAFLNTGNKYGRYVIEKYYSYNKEYRLHVSSRGVCFYTCRKMLKSGTPEEQKWVRNDSTCVWILEENEMFDKPKTWDRIVQECVKATRAVGLDVSAVDVRVNNDGQYIILETNSAPSFGDLTLDKYQEEIPQLAWYKIQEMAKA